MNALHPRHRHATADLSPAIGMAMASFTNGQAAWTESTTQDAIESVQRIPWLYQVRSGVRVPIDVLYRTSARRLAQAEASRFVSSQSRRVALLVGVPAPALHLTGWEVIEAATTATGMEDPLIRRSWTEAEVPWRRRFEHVVRTELEVGGTRPLQDWLEDTLLSVVAAWDRVADRGLVPTHTFQ